MLTNTGGWGKYFSVNIEFRPTDVQPGTHSLGYTCLCLHTCFLIHHDSQASHHHAYYYHHHPKSPSDDAIGYSCNLWFNNNESDIKPITMHAYRTVNVIITVLSLGLNLLPSNPHKRPEKKIFPHIIWYKEVLCNCNWFIIPAYSRQCTARAKNSGAVLSEDSWNNIMVRRYCDHIG